MLTFSTSLQYIIYIAVNQLYHACKGCISFYQLSPSGYALGLELIKLMQPLHAWYNYYVHDNNIFFTM